MRRIFALSLMCLAVFLLPASHGVEAQVSTDPEVDAILSELSPEARVGQLFLVTYFGTDVGPDSDIVTLVNDYRVGGVVLLRANDNFSEDQPLPEQVLEVTGALQNAAAGVTPVDSEGGEEATPVPPSAQTPRSDFIPLFIAAEHEGAGWPDVDLVSGLTPLPSNMAIGATWDVGNAEAAGQIVGQELSALGINMLIGPPADVVSIPQPSAQGDLGTTVFGGEPIWVSQMTASYVRGVHLGSSERMVVVPKHFPGYGGADRFATVEIPTVIRTRDQLIQSDLKPFFAVTGDAVDPESVADGILVGHIRYRGFQADNLRAETKPISLDPAALQSLLSLPSIAPWHEAGGLVISDSLGLRGVRRHYDPTEETFQGRRIALDAFVAGNDVLYLGNYGLDPAVDQTTSIIDTIDFFVQRYEDEPAFRELVDSSVRRIIRQKLDMYGEFSLDTVQPSSEGLAALGSQGGVTTDIARGALTLLSPDQNELLAAPERGDNIVIFTDTRTASLCSDCSSTPLIAVDALRSSILRFYGPDATGLVSFADVAPYSFADLDEYLEFTPPPVVGDGDSTATSEPDPLEFSLNAADWVVFVMLGAAPNLPAVDVVHRFLAEPPVGPETRIVVMAMGGPYYLDATEISKLSAYYALYSHTQPFVDVATRALFQEFVPVGASPVSIPGIDYSILPATSPSPDQVISLTWMLVPEEGEVQPGSGTLEPTVEVGDTLRVTTGVIVDYNGNPVPDGTQVEFVLNYEAEGIRETQTSLTDNGIAETTVIVSRPGTLTVTAASGAATTSGIIQLINGSISTRNPNLAPTLTPTPTDTPQPEETEPPVLTPEPTATLGLEPLPRAVNFADLFLALIGLMGIAVAAFVIGFTTRDFNYGLLLGLPAFIFGFMGYNYYALLLPGALPWRSRLGDGWSAGVAAWVSGVGGSLLAAGLLYLWENRIVEWLRDRKRQREEGR